MSDFIRNHKAHIARLKETRMPEVLTVNGRAEVVMLDTESYENLMSRLRQMESITAIRGLIARSKSDQDAILTSEELERRGQVMDELTAETERLGLYR
ncbi:MAG: type II toxin-antitoxin system Phd/YefM family antitoxin [Capsulimonas sp.]|uniref:type II toxin-antitoxin system Phd/YefM family antitoxin n=1 Tax=Capsulimonas sp. TaxID=2494211 RepID=UPI00326420FA